MNVQFCKKKKKCFVRKQINAFIIINLPISYLKLIVNKLTEFTNTTKMYQNLFIRTWHLKKSCSNVIRGPRLTYTVLPEQSTKRSL